MYVPAFLNTQPPFVYHLNVLPLRRFGPQFVVLGGQYHLIEVRKAQMSITVMTVEADEVDDVFSSEVFFKLFLVIRVLQNEIINVLMVDSKLRLHGISATNSSESIIALEGLLLGNLLPYFFDVYLRLTDELEHLVHGAHQELLSLGVISYSWLRWQLFLGLESLHIALPDRRLQLSSLQSGQASSFVLASTLRSLVLLLEAVGSQQVLGKEPLGSDSLLLLFSQYLISDHPVVSTALLGHFEVEVEESLGSVEVLGILERRGVIGYFRSSA